MGQNAHAGQNANIHMAYGVKCYWNKHVLINRHFEEARLLVAFYDEF